MPIPILLLFFEQMSILMYHNHLNIAPGNIKNMFKKHYLFIIAGLNLSPIKIFMYMYNKEKIKASIICF